MKKFTVHTIDLHFQGIERVIASYLIEGPSGLILLEPGPYSSFNTLSTKLNALGYKPEEVQDVFVTHVHFDHAGAAWAFAKTGSRIHVHPFGKRHLAHPQRLWNSAARIYGEAGMTSLWGDMLPIDEHLLVDWAPGTEKIVAGLSVKAHHTPGHAKHHIAWQLEDCIFLGDVGGVKIGEGPVEPPCPPPDINLEDWMQSIELLKAVTNAKRSFLTHYGELTGSNTAHYDQLSNKLMDWYRFIEKNQQLKLHELTIKFEKMVEYERRRITSKSESYSLANPAMMSVTGLLRYIELKADLANGTD